jgi:hypothetical protein
LETDEVHHVPLLLGLPAALLAGHFLAALGQHIKERAVGEALERGETLWNLLRGERLPYKALSAEAYGLSVLRVSWGLCVFDPFLGTGRLKVSLERRRNWPS